MPQCLKCGAGLTVNEEGVAPVLCDNCAGVATKRASRSLSAVGTMRQFPVTTALLAVNVAVYVAMVVTSGSLTFSGWQRIHWGGNYGPYTIGGDYWRLITSCFVHADILHIAFNMWCLWSLGRLCERLFGRWQTVAIYLLTGVGGALLSISYHPQVLSVGASGAIFGIGGAILAGLKFGNISISAGERRSIFSSLVFFVGFNLMLGFGNFNFFGSGKTDNMAHLGGLFSGLIIGLPLGTSLSASPAKTKLFQVITLAITALLLATGAKELTRIRGGVSPALRTALKSNNYPAAIKLLEQSAAAHPDDAAIQETLGETYEKTHELDKAVAAFERAAQLDPGSAERQAMLCAAYATNEQSDKAITACEQSLKLDSNLPGVADMLQELRASNPTKK
jgi:membrane associated rhomboid family serine protease